MPYFTIRHKSRILQSSIDGDNPDAAAAAAIICVLVHFGFDPASEPARKLLNDLAIAGASVDQIELE